MSLHTGDTIEVTTVDVAQGGWCVARPEDGPVVFVRHALPGERVRARVTEVTSRFARADAVHILDQSPERIDAACPSARPGGCGGCDWQHAALPAQRALKATVIEQQLRRLAGIDRKVTVEPLPGDEDPSADGDPSAGGDRRAAGGQPGAAPQPAGDNSKKPQAGLGWRTRMQFAVGRDGRAGLRAHRSHEVIDIGDCPIAHPAITDLGITALSWDGATGVEAVTGDGESAVIVTSGESATHGKRGRSGQRPRKAVDAEGAERPGQRPEKAEAEPDAMIQDRDGRRRAPNGEQDRAPGAEPDGVTAVAAATVLRRAGRRLSPVRGRPALRQRAAGRDWRVSAGAFWQVHPAAADTLSEVVVDVLAPEPGDVVFDLYCGAGLFAGVLAPLVGPEGVVVGIESDDIAVRDARHNLRDTPWARVHRGDVARVLRRAGEQARPGQPRYSLPEATLAVADPPRAGLARSVIDDLSSGGARRFAYVSCDPATLARDLGLLLARGWRLDGLRAFDAFPMTHHVECVAALSR